MRGLICAFCGGAVPPAKSAGWTRIYCSPACKNKGDAKPQRTVDERFDEYCASSFPDENGCWNWTGPRIKAGYGSMAVGSVVTGTDRKVYAHRYSYERHVGPIPDGMVIDHLCCNPSCVNPAHLEAVAHAENIRRGFARKMERGWKKAGQKGVEQSQAKLTDDAVREIRASSETHAALARKFGVAAATIRRVRLGRNWQHVVPAMPDKQMPAPKPLVVQ